MKSRSDFCPDALLLPENGKAHLSFTPGGHISCNWVPHALSVVANPSWGNEAFRARSVDDPILPLEATSLLRIHKQLGHDSASTISRVCKRAERSISEAASQQTILDCGCGRTESVPQVPRTNRYQSVAPGETVFSDAIYPDSRRQDKHAILFVGAFSRFCIVRFLPSMRPLSVITLLLGVWAVTFGMPPSSIVDSGRTFMGPEWKQVCDMFPCD